MTLLQPQIITAVSVHGHWMSLPIHFRGPAEFYESKTKAFLIWRKWNSISLINIVYENSLAHSPKPAPRVCHLAYKRRGAHSQEGFLGVPDSFSQGKKPWEGGEETFWVITPGQDQRGNSKASVEQEHIRADVLGDPQRGCYEPWTASVCQELLLRTSQPPLFFY